MVIIMSDLTMHYMKYLRMICCLSALVFSVQIAHSHAARDIDSTNSLSGPNSNGNLHADHKSFAEDVATPLMNIASGAIKEKYLELKQMLKKRGSIDSDKEPNYMTCSTDLCGRDALEAAPVLKVFVSSSMNSNLLTQYALSAKKYGATLIFKGLPNGSWIELSNLIANLTKNIENTDEISIQIDDEAFKFFGITSVPSFVLTEESGDPVRDEKLIVYDKASGNIGIKGALKLFAGSGDLANIAAKILQDKEKK